MLFDRNKKQKKCEDCGAKTEEKHSFCPHCGNSFLDLEKDRENYGLLGRNDFEEIEEDLAQVQGFGVMDKLMSSMFNSLMKNFDKQLKSQFEESEEEFGVPEVRTFPNGVSIKISGPLQGQPRKKKQQKPEAKRVLGEEQLKKMSSLPRTKAKAGVKRFGDKIVYELSTSGVSSVEDIFVSKLESGYEIKAIGEKKIYVNSVPINLPLRKCSLLKNKVSLEFW
ncbi:MAG: zinc ribbon domain-containing protein [Nanoarchaeota archaeon]|nr:zinc ribbon domain-containing protein [Nanoarchaeota archaeon]MBU1103518.1 zinc ribbon domain-containing protein [Nanoarchaeota archaeon]